MSKLLKTLAHAKLVVSRRGSHGGYSLASSPTSISALDVIEAIEGPLAVTECTLAPGLCELETTCQLSSQWRHLSVAVGRALAEITLEDLIGDPIDPQLSMRRPAPKSTARMEPSHGHA